MCGPSRGTWRAWILLCASQWWATYPTQPSSTQNVGGLHRKHLVSVLLVLDTHITLQAASDSTKHDPPNISEFDGDRDGRGAAAKPRGRSGPYSASASASSNSSSTSSDTTNLLMAAILGSITHNKKRNRSVSPINISPPRSTRHSRSLSPLPGVGSELRACLSAFAESRGIDMIACEEALLALDLTPDIIPEVPVARLCSITGAIEGKVMKFQQYCKEWHAQWQAKSLRAEKRRRLE